MKSSLTEWVLSSPVPIPINLQNFLGHINKFQHSSTNFCAPTNFKPFLDFQIQGSSANFKPPKKFQSSSKISRQVCKFLSRPKGTKQSADSQDDSSLE